MQDWKINQKIFRALGVKNDLLGIDIPDHKIKTVTEDLITAIDRQFSDCEYLWIPAKSYCVALVYARELVNDYGGTLQQYLDDPELLQDDCHYRRYRHTPDVYDYFINDTAWYHKPMAELIKQYYRKEIQLYGLFS